MFLVVSSLLSNLVRRLVESLTKTPHSDIYLVIFFNVIFVKFRPRYREQSRYTEANLVIYVLGLI